MKDAAPADLEPTEAAGAHPRRVATTTNVVRAPARCRDNDLTQPTVGVACLDVQAGRGRVGGRIVPSRPADRAPATVLAIA